MIKYITTLSSNIYLEPISKIADHAQEQGKSRRKSAAYVQYVSILRWLLTQLLSVRCIFEMGSTKILRVIAWFRVEGVSFVFFAFMATAGKRCSGFCLKAQRSASQAQRS